MQNINALNYGYYVRVCLIMSAYLPQKAVFVSYVWYV